MRAAWQGKLDQFLADFHGADLTPAFMAADVEMSHGFAENFYNTTGGNAEFWPPHAPATVARHGPHPLLILTGKMFDAATNVDSPGHLRHIAGDEMTIGIKGSHVPYAHFHQTGTVNMPKRQVIHATAETEQRARDAFADELDKLFLG